MAYASTAQRGAAAPSQSDDPGRARRLAAVANLGALDRIGDPVLVSLTRLAQAVTGASAAAVHIFDERHQRRIAATGAPMGDHPSEDALCRLVVEGGTRIVCADAISEPRFSYSSFVEGPAPVRFYASVPVRVHGDTTIGTICAWDTVPRALTTAQIAHLEDVAELAQAHLMLVQLAGDLGRDATRDCLTGVDNRAVFDARLAEALARKRQAGGEVLVAIADLDDFKSINDTYGHGRGDAALRWVGDRLSELVGSRGTVGRIGGDEFAIISDLDGTEAELLLSEIGLAGYSFDPPFRISVGSAYAELSDDVPSLMRRADQRMYAEKATGQRMPFRAARVWA